MKNCFRKCFFMIAASILIHSIPLSAEIQRITVKWNPQICLDSCVRDIQKQLVQLNGVAEIVFTPGQADIRWKPRVPFNWQYINTAIRVVGIPLLDVRVQVRGTIVATQTAVIIQSLGDNTQFFVLSPARTSLNQFIPQGDFASHPLSPELRQELMDAERDSCVVEISGPLLRPQMGLFLIAEQVNIIRLGAKQASAYVPQGR